MTYLEMVNQVSIRLREETVTSVSETDFSFMHGAFVNDAMKIVEDAWHWSGLRQEVTVQTVPDQQNYSLTSSDKYDIITNVYNDKTKQNICEFSAPRMRELTRSLSTATETIGWSWGNPSAGLATIDLFAIPSTTHDLFLDMVVKTEPFTADGDIFNVPTQPILYLALAYAARERGEVQGQSVAEVFALATKYLGDAVSLDADRFPNETLFTVE